MAEELLAAHHLCVRYRNGALGVIDVSLRIRSSTLVTLLGPNGAGKTTTVRAISGFLRNERVRVVSGTVEFMGRNITGWEPHRIAKLGICVVPERRKIFPNLTVQEHLSIAGLALPRRRRKEAADLAHHIFPILAERARESAGRLSGGQQQMLALGRAVASGPKLLVIDEMTLGLHPSLHPVLFATVREIVASGTGTAALIVDERVPNVADVSDDSLFIESGRTADGAGRSIAGRLAESVLADRLRDIGATDGRGNA